ncbi:GntR family transcriptional regulator [Roseobacteraceae bacterium S113]
MSTLPRHLQISEMLVREIKAGIRVDGDRLPPERALAVELGVSVGTLRKALADLTDKGMLERVQGSGNYVRDNPAVENIYALFRLELASGGGLPTANLLSVERLAKPADVPDLDGTAEAFRFRRIRALDGVEIAAEEMWLAGSSTPAIAAKDVGDSLYQFYRDRLGFQNHACRRSCLCGGPSRLGPRPPDPASPRLGLHRTPFARRERSPCRILPHMV